MNFTKLLLPLAVLSGLLSSCIVPYSPNPRAPIMGQAPDLIDGPQTVDTEEQKRLREVRAEAGRRERELEALNNPPEPTVPDKPNPQPSRDYRHGIPIPGKEGFVFNPFTNNPVDVRAIPPGTLVRDPQDPNPDHKFRVP